MRYLKLKIITTIFLTVLLFPTSLNITVNADDSPIVEYDTIFYEDFTGVVQTAIPTGWTKTPSTHNWGALFTNNAGGVLPEMRFYYVPVSTDDFYLITPEIDTSAFTRLDFSFRHYLNHYSGDYTLKVVALAGGNEYTIDEWVNPTGFGATLESYVLTTAHGVGASDFQLAWVFSGYSWNVSYWCFDDVELISPVIPVSVDIKPGTCPNTINTKSRGVLSVAICGTEDFDITTIDPATIRIDINCGGVSPLRWSYYDEATPFVEELCDCHELTGDGYLDLILKFKTQEVINSIGFVYDGYVITLLISGNLKEEYDGIPILGSDCVVIKDK
jgi:hypothetical protein